MKRIAFLALLTITACQPSQPSKPQDAPTNAPTVNVERLRRIVAWSGIDRDVMTNEEVLRFSAPYIERISEDTLRKQSVSALRSKLESLRKGRNQHPWTEEDLQKALRAKNATE